jgi:hypothetical protein
MGLTCGKSFKFSGSRLHRQVPNYEILLFYEGRNREYNKSLLNKKNSYSYDEISPTILKISSPFIVYMLVNKKTDWESFRMTTEERIQLTVPLQTEEQLAFEVEKFVNDIQQSAWENIPEIKRRLKGDNYPK